MKKKGVVLSVVFGIVAVGVSFFFLHNRKKILSSGSDDIDFDL